MRGIEPIKISKKKVVTCTIWPTLFVKVEIKKVLLKNAVYGRVTVIDHKYSGTRPGDFTPFNNLR